MSPIDLTSQVLVKGKVKPSKEKKASSGRGSMRVSMRALASIPDGLSRLRSDLSSAGTSVTEVAKVHHASSRETDVARAESEISPRATDTDSPSDRATDTNSAVVDKKVRPDAHELFEPRASRRLIFSPSQQISATRQLVKKQKSSKTGTNDFYASILAVRAEPVSAFVAWSTPKSALPITSFSEDRYLKELGLPAEVRNRLEGLLVGRASSHDGQTEEQQVSRAIIQLASDPPPTVGKMQRRSARWLMRPYPLG